jgi:tRNA1(Val) A37 N6-methylase TrmN6
METTDGHLLGGRVRYAQSGQGFRSGIEPVLLAAAIPAREGDRVLEGGSGAGAGLLCLAARVSAITGLGIERDPSLAALAQRNAVANGLTGLTFLSASVEAIPETGRFDHAFANPPYHVAAGTPSPGRDRAEAKHAGADLFAIWAKSLAFRLRPRGTLTLIVSAADLPACIEAFAAAQCGSTTLLPLWPRHGAAAKLALLQGVKGGRGPFRILPGLVLHRDGCGYTPEAEAILRDVSALPI